MTVPPRLEQFVAARASAAAPSTTLAPRAPDKTRRRSKRNMNTSHHRRGIGQSDTSSGSCLLYKTRPVNRCEGVAVLFVHETWLTPRVRDDKVYPRLDEPVVPVLVRQVGIEDHRVSRLEVV